MSHHKLVEKRISYLVAISLVILIAFAVRLIDIQGSYSPSMTTDSSVGPSANDVAKVLEGSK